MSLLVAVRNANANRVNAGATESWLIPGSSLSGSTAPMAASGPNATLNTNAGFTWYPWPDANPSIGVRSARDQNRPDCYPLKFNDFLNRADRLTWNSSTWPSTVSTSLSTYSFRMNWFSEYSGATKFYDEHLVSFNANSGAVTSEGSRVWSIYLTKTLSLPSAFYGFNVNAEYQPYLRDGSEAVITTSPVSWDPQYDTANSKQLLGGQWWRVEVQVQPTAPKITVKFYSAMTGAGSLMLTLTASPASLAAVNQFTIGKRTLSVDGGAVTGILLQRWYSNLEFYNDYTLNGTVGLGYTPPSLGWQEMVAGSPVTVRDTGVDSGSNVFDDGPKECFKSEVVLSSSSYTTWENASGGWSPFYDSAGRAERRITLYTPNGTPPTNGWPCVVWAHDGFFAFKSRFALPDQFRNHLLLNGYAVATVEYVLGTALIGLPTAKPAWFASGAGMFPSFIIDFKMAARYLQLNYSTNVAGRPFLDDEKFCASGYSAGGYIALGAATTRDLTITTSTGPVDTTLTNATYANASGSSTSWGDPIFKCAYVFAAPVDWVKMWDYDPTHPTWGAAGGILGGDPTGTLKTTINTFLGRNYNTNRTLAGSAAGLSGISINEFVAANSAKVPPIRYCRGRGDYLVHWENPESLSSAMTAAGLGASYSLAENNAFHDLVNEQFDPRSLCEGPLSFLRTNGM